MNRENVVDTFSGLFDSLQRRKRDGSEGILSGCEAELHELMRQIDIMVNAKKVEWDNQLHVLQLHLDKKKKEAGMLKIEIGAKIQETENLRHQITAMDHSQRELINEYEEKLSQLRDEVNKLRRDHEKLQKKSQNRNNEIEVEKDRLKSDLHKRDLDLQKVKDQNEEMKVKLRDWDSIGRTHQERVKGLEVEKLTLKDKNDILQNQGQEIQDMLSQRKHTLENLEKSHQIEMVELDNQISKLRGQDDEHKTTISELEAALKEHQASDKEKSSELAYMDGRLRHAHEVIQALELEKEQLQLELNSKRNLLKHLEEKQRHQKQDLSNLEKNLYQRDGVIRDLQEVGVQEEASTIVRLREDLRICQTESSSKKETETFLRAENERLTKSLTNCEKEFKRSNIELLQKNEQLASQGQDDVGKLLSENSKMRDHLQRLEDSRSSEVEGMKSEVGNLASDLHQRDITIASMSEKMTRLERDLRNSNSEYDKGMAKLHVVMAQLEALRLENRHIKEATFEGELRDLDLYHSNQQFMADMQDENTSLQMESTLLREELARSATKEKQSPDRSRKASPTIENISTDVSRKNNAVHETLRLSNERQPAGSGQGTGATIGGYFHHRKHSGSITTSPTESDDPRRLSFGDLKGPGSDYERAGSPSTSRRSSITANFVAEETRREKELERILDGRLNELKLTTKNILGDYPPR